MPFDPSDLLTFAAMASRSRSPCRAASSALTLVLDANRESVVERQRREILLLQKQATVYFMKMAAQQTTQNFQSSGTSKVFAEWQHSSMYRDPTEKEWYEYEFEAACSDAVRANALCEKCQTAHGNAPGQWHADITSQFTPTEFVERQKEWPCVDCPDAVESIGNRLECPRKHDSKGFRDGMVEMMKIARFSRR